MIRSLSPGDRRTLWTGTAVILLLVLLGRGIPAWRRWDADVRASAAEMAAEAARAESETRRLPAALDSLQARRARYAALGRGILGGESTAAAGASLAALVSGTAARAGVQIGSVQVRPDTAGAGTFMRVAVQADGTGDLAAVTRMLVMLEGSPELLAVRQIAITQPNPGGPAELPESLRLDITVEGLALSTPGTLTRDAGAPPDDGAADAMPVDTLPLAGDSLLEALP